MFIAGVNLDCGMAHGEEWQDNAAESHEEDEARHGHA